MVEVEFMGGENEKKVQKQGKFSKILDTRLIALFVLGILIGVTVKTQASKTITMGYDDYRLRSTKQEFDLSQAKIEKEQAEEVETAEGMEDDEATAGDEEVLEN